MFYALFDVLLNRLHYGKKKDVTCLLLQLKNLYFQL